MRKWWNLNFVLFLLFAEIQKMYFTMHFTFVFYLSFFALFLFGVVFGYTCVFIINLKRNKLFRDIPLVFIFH